MRDLKPRWPKWAFFLVAVAGLWWGTGALPEGGGVPLAGRSLVPPALAILIAFAFKKVGWALFAGIASAAVLAAGFDAAASARKLGLDYLWAGASDPWNLKVYAFTLVLIGMVNVAIRMGGMEGLVRRVGRVTRGPRSAQAATGLMGVAVFFDDYANAVVVGGAARPITDAKKVSREKLAYAVDATSAPVAGLAIVSTWIAVEIAYFEGVLPQLGDFAKDLPNGYSVFLGALPYRYYCIFCIALVLLVAALGRDFGPMLRAERDARRGIRTKGLTGAVYARSQAETKEGVPARAVNAVLPVAVVLGGVLFGFAFQGRSALAAKGVEVDLLSFAGFRDAFVAVEDSVTVLLWAALAGTGTAFVLALVQRLLTVREAFATWFRGVLFMLPAVGILFLAMTIQKGVKDVQAATYMASLLRDVPPAFFPLATFLLASLIAFATGTSYGTMGILIPLVMPVGAALFAGHPHGEVLLLLLAGSVLDGAIFGDHCSPISDTTVLSSIASGCDHVEHVRTQLPYALLGMFAAAGAGYSLVALTGGSLYWLSYPLGLAFMTGWLLVVGRRPEAE